MQAFDDFDYRTLAQIVCSRLETEAQHADAPMALIHDQLQASRDLHFVAGRMEAENGKLQIVHFGLICQRPEIFGQTGPAERKSRQKIGRGNVELRSWQKIFITS